MMDMWRLCCTDFFLASPVNASSHISSQLSAQSFIFWEVRLPRSLTAVCVGAGLGVSGLLSQTFFRNALAEPNVLGVTAGASLGVAFLTFGVGESFTKILLWQHDGVWAIFLVSAVGALLVMLLMLLVAWRVQDATVLLISGFMVGSFVGALVAFWQYFSHPEQIQNFMRWSMGSLAGVANVQLRILFFINFVGILGTFLISKWLNIWLMGDLYAQGLGVSLLKMRVICVFLISILAGNITAFCGLIGFLGIVIPHISRWYIQSNQHQHLTPLCVLFGACLLLFCDMIAKMPAFGGVLPLNIVSSLMGIPFVLMVVLSQKRY